MRHVANWINLSTLLGLALAWAAGTSVRRTPDLAFLAVGYRWRFPFATAFTVGDVVMTRAKPTSAEPPAPLKVSVMAHELRHSGQWAWWLGLPFLPAYLVACGYSYVVCGDHWSYNAFEVRAGLEAGGYVRAPRRALFS